MNTIAGATAGTSSSSAIMTRPYGGQAERPCGAGAYARRREKKAEDLRQKKANEEDKAQQKNKDKKISMLREDQEG